MNIKEKRQAVRKYLTTQKISMVDVGFDEDTTVDNATEAMLDSVLDDIFENFREKKLEETYLMLVEKRPRCEWVSIGLDKVDNTEKYIPTCNAGRGMPLTNSGYFKYCPFCGKLIGWVTTSLKGETEELL